tara:strand:+ start:222 stop:353 length:132 start_codon:yes stop_codon:yes gene_type:complete
LKGSLQGTNINPEIKNKGTPEIKRTKEHLRSTEGGGAEEEEAI